MNTVLRVALRGVVRVAGAAWHAPVLALHQGAVVSVRMQAGTVEAVIDGAAHVLTRVEG